MTTITYAQSSANTRARTQILCHKHTRAGAVCLDGFCSLPKVECTGSEIKGEWKRLPDGTFALLSCPTGHQLINETGHDFQTCGRCETGFFINSPNDPNEGSLRQMLCMCSPFTCMRKRACAFSSGGAPAALSGKQLLNSLR